MERRSRGAPGDFRPYTFCSLQFLIIGIESSQIWGPRKLTSKVLTYPTKTWRCVNFALATKPESRQFFPTSCE